MQLSPFEIYLKRLPASPQTRAIEELVLQYETAKDDIERQPAIFRLHVIIQRPSEKHSDST